MVKYPSALIALVVAFWFVCTPSKLVEAQSATSIIRKLPSGINFTPFQKLGYRNPWRQRSGPVNVAKLATKQIQQQRKQAQAYIPKAEKSLARWKEELTELQPKLVGAKVDVMKATETESEAQAARVMAARRLSSQGGSTDKTPVDRKAFEAARTEEMEADGELRNRKSELYAMNSRFMALRNAIAIVQPTLVDAKAYVARTERFAKKQRKDSKQNRNRKNKSSKK